MGVEHLPQNLFRIRRLKNINMEDLSTKIGVSRQAYSNLEHGKSQPKSSTLAKLSKELNVDINDLLADPPRFKSLRFRSNKTLSKTEENIREQLIYDVHRWLKDYNELASILQYPEPRPLKVRTVDPKKAAEEFREFLQIKNDEPINDIIGLLEKYQIRFFLKESKLKNFFGFSVGIQDGGPAIIVNTDNGITIERQIFTVAHELGHILLHKSSFVSNELEEIVQQEKEANMFAGYFLLPPVGFQKELVDSKGLNWIDTVLHVKRKFKVSYKTVLYRLIEQYDHIPGKLYSQFAVGIKDRYGISLKNHYEPYPIEEEEKNEPEKLSQYDFVEDKLKRLVREAYEQEEISFSRAAEILHLSSEDMRALIKSWTVIV
ncbi:MAG: helix-turn-helix domain-containing protein [Spirochaetia bacterium]